MISFAAIANGAIAELNSVLHDVLLRMFEIIKTPLTNPEVLWIIIPIVLSMILIAFYYGEYKKEMTDEFCWSNAFSNSIVFIFACVDLFRYLHINHMLGFNTKTILVTVILSEGLIMTLLDYLHAMPKELAFGLSSGMTVNSIVLSLILIIYSNVPLDYVTALAVIFLSFGIILLLRIMQFLEWGKDEEETQ